MPTPQSIVNVFAHGSGFGTGDYVIFRNLTRESKKVVRCNSAGEAMVEDVPANWQDGDEFFVEVQGKYKIGKTGTVTKGNLNIDLGSASEDSASPAVDI